MVYSNIRPSQLFGIYIMLKPSPSPSKGKQNGKKEVQNVLETIHFKSP